MSKQIKAAKQVRPTGKAHIETARKVWLAGLGAFSIAQKQGAELFESMVGEGKSFQTRSENLARKLSGEIKSAVGKRMKPVKARLRSVRRNAEARLELGVGRALSYVGVPSKADVDALISRVDALSRQLRAAR